MSQSFFSQLSFDQWVELAQKNPEKLDQIKQQMVNEVIDQAAPDRQPRLRAFQWKLEQISRIAPSPLSACVTYSRMMWKQIYGEQGLVSACQISSHKAKILPLKK